MVVRLEGEESRKGFRGYTAESYLAANEHPAWPRPRLASVLVSKASGNPHLRSMCDFGYSCEDSLAEYT